MPVGKLNEFDSTVEPWNQYAGRLEFYLHCNGITDAGKKKSTFLTVIGPSTYGLLLNLIVPEDISTKSYEDLLALAKAYFSPAPSEIVERVKFYSRTRGTGEPVATFISELKSLSQHCNFGANLSEMLRDRLVCGINDEELQTRLLQEPAAELTLEKALKLAQAFETATKNVRDLHSLEKLDNTSVNFLKGSKPSYKKKTTYGKQQTPQPAPNSSFKSKNQLWGKNQECIRCGKMDHKPADCFHLKTTCSTCGKVGHLARKCLSGPPAQGNSGFKKVVHSVKPSFLEPLNECKLPDGYNTEYNTFHLSAADQGRLNYEPPLLRNFTVNGKILNMEIDTGSHDSLISEAVFQQLGLGQASTMERVSLNLTSFTGHNIQVLGRTVVSVQYNGRKEQLPLHVYAGRGPTLCGRRWIFSGLSIIPNIIQHIGGEKYPQGLEAILEKHREIFSPTLGLLKDVSVKLRLLPEAAPRFCKARSVPYALRDKVDAELLRLEKEGVIVPVKHSEWAAPIVPVLKGDQTTIRICGDYKLTVNQATVTEYYPLPKVDDLFAQLSGGKKFTKLDLREAYNQLQLDPESQKLVVVNTLQGLFAYTRLPFGVASAPAIFQRHIETLLKGTPGTCNFLDDILVTGGDDATHLSNLDTVLTRLEGAGLKLKKNKCLFFQDQVSYLGHLIDSEGLHPLESKMEAIMEAPAPTSVEQLRSFLGLIGYYGKFIPNQATLLAPLYQLLTKNQPWMWNGAENAAFNDAKRALHESSVLVHFDPAKELILACDASGYGIAAVLSHNVNGVDRPISFASRSLAPAEKNYSTIEKEALAIVFGVSKFRDYLLGRNFTLLTDHRPLVVLFSDNKSVPSMASARIQRWALALSAYTYKIVFKKGELNSNADALSRLPLPVSPEYVPMPPELILLIRSLNDSPVTALQMKVETSKDKVLSQVLSFVEGEWPENLDPSMSPYSTRRIELSVSHGILLWGNRAVVPTSLRETILAELHESHQGMTSTKGLARTKVWWPLMDNDIERLVRTCGICQEHSAMPPSTGLSPWPVSTTPWSRIHIDYAGPLEGKMMLIIVDSHTKWIEAVPLSTATSAGTILTLQNIFARFGLPKTVVSDNGSPFTSVEFKSFLERNGIKQMLTAPYHPCSNGLAERAVRTVKTGLKKLTSGTLQQKLDAFLQSYRRTPVQSIGVSPAELLLGREMRTRLDLIQPNNLEISSLMEPVPPTDKPKFETGDKVFVRNYGLGPKWFPGTVISKEGNIMFSCETPRGIARRHQNQLRSRLIVGRESVSTDCERFPPKPLLQSQLLPHHVNPFSPSFTSPLKTPVSPGNVLLEPQDIDPATPVTPVGEQCLSGNVLGETPKIPARRCTSRLRRAPIRLNL